MKNAFDSASHAWKRILGTAIAGMLAISMIPAIPESQVSATDSAAQYPSDMFKAGTIPVSESSVTKDEPFAPGTGDSQCFRIPAIITLENGDLLATVDARYSQTSDGGGLDTIASVSSDGGRTWNYSFPMYFPDSDGYAGTSATTIIDPGIVEGPDGTVYCMADVNPTGATTLYQNPVPEGTGYVTVNGKRYLALTDNYANVNTRPTDEDTTTYAYYVSDFDENGYAPILKRADNSRTQYGVDRYYNLYSIDENGAYVDDLKQNQVNNANKQIQQNVFYQGSALHIYKIAHIWVVASKDHGRTWEPPVDITDQIKRHSGENAILVSPGQGMVTDAGDILIGVYDHGSAGNNREDAGFIYSSDNGETWGRTNDIGDVSNAWSSENEIVELEDGTIRMFYRSGRGKVCYADAEKASDGSYTFVRDADTKTSVTSTCNVSAIKYSRKINGKDAIMVACPGGPNRANGKIFTFLVNSDENKTMELFNTFSVPDSAPSYVYSCLTEMEDGTVALLWEGGNGELRIFFDKFSILDIAPEACVEGVETAVNLTTNGEDYVRNYTKESEAVVTQAPDEKIASVNIQQSEDSAQKTLSFTAVGEGYTKAIVDGVLYRISVKDDTKVLVKGESQTITDVREITEKPADESVISVELMDGNKVGVFDHAANENSSLNSFSETQNTEESIEKAEFTFTASESNWRIYNAANNKYLVNTGAGSYFADSAQDMYVNVNTSAQTVRISQKNATTNGGFVVFNLNGMYFDRMGNYGEMESLDYDFVLLEKQDEMSPDDILPGYKRVSNITSGKNYLITYIWTGENEEQGVIILYPVNGTSNQTKLARITKEAKITAKGEGTASVTLNGKKYDYKVIGKTCSHSQTVVVGTIPAECDTDGYTGDTVCSNCRQIMIKGESIPASGHVWDDVGTVIKQVTKTEDGEIAYHCKNDPFHTKLEVIYAAAYGPLLDEYQKAERLLENSGLYTDGTVNALEDAFDIYKGIVENQGGKRSEMLRGAEVLAVASASLKMKTGNELNDELGGALQEAGSIKDLGQGGYSDDAWNSFLEAYRKAEEGQKNAGTDPEALWEALKPLKNAVDTLKKQEQEIQAAVAELEKELNSSASFYQNGKGKYEEPGWSEFVKAYEDAKNLSKNKDAETLKALMSKLEAARKALKPAIVALPEQNQDTLKAGDMVTVKNVQYKVLDPAKKTAAAFKGSKNTLAKVTIQATVNIKGVTCTVTEISTNAFKGYKKLTNVTIGKNVKTIGKNAFNGCKKLKKVTFKGTAVKKIKSGAFKKTGAKMTVKVPKKMTKKQRATLLKKLKKAGASKKAKLQ